MKFKNQTDLINQSIEEIENDVWEDEDDYPTNLVKRVHEVRKKKIRDFTDDDLRISIQEKLCLEVTAPIAISKVEKNVLLEALYFPGDLLLSLLKADLYWSEHKTDKKTFQSFVNSKLDDIKLSSEITDEIKKSLINVIKDKWSD